MVKEIIFIFLLLNFVAFGIFVEIRKQGGLDRQAQKIQTKVSPVERAPANELSSIHH